MRLDLDVAKDLCLAGEPHLVFVPNRKSGNGQSQLFAAGFGRTVFNALFHIQVTSAARTAPDERRQCAVFAKFPLHEVGQDGTIQSGSQARWPAEPMVMQRNSIGEGRFAQVGAVFNFDFLFLVDERDLWHFGPLGLHLLPPLSAPL